MADNPQVKVPIWSPEEFVLGGKYDMDVYYNVLQRLENIIIDNPEKSLNKIVVMIQTPEGETQPFLMNLGALYLNVVIWIFNVTFEEPVTTEDIHSFDNITKGKYVQIMSSIVEKFVNLGHDVDNSMCLAHIRFRISRLTKIHSIHVSNTFSLYDLLMYESRSDNFAEIFNTEFSLDKMTPAQMEEYKDMANKVLMKDIEEDAQNNLYPFVTTGILSGKQLKQMFIAIGSRTDIDNIILPEVISGNYVRGLKNIAEFYVESVQTRNALIIKEEAVPQSGYLSRKVNLACINTSLNYDIIDCGTKHTIDWFIDSKETLDIIEGKYMIVDPVGPKVKAISSSDTHLIGTTVKVRSHTKCITAHEIGEVCCTCLGNRHKTLKNSRIGGLVSIKFTNPVSQSGLSTKHAMESTSSNITDYLISTYMNIASNGSVYINKNMVRRGEESPKLLIPVEVVSEILSAKNIYETGAGSEFVAYLSELLIVDKDNTLLVQSLDDKPYRLAVSSGLLKFINRKNNKVIVNHSEIDVVDLTHYDGDFEPWNEYISIDYRQFNKDTPVFTLNVVSEEVSKHLKDIKALIDNSRKKPFSDPAGMIQALLQVAKNAGILSSGIIIHIETLVLNLMRDPYNPIKRPDYRNKIEPEVTFVSLANAISRSDLFGGLAFQEMKRQLADPISLEKEIPGVYDPLFANSVYDEVTKEFKERRPYLFQDK